MKLKNLIEKWDKRVKNTLPGIKKESPKKVDKAKDEKYNPTKSIDEIRKHKRLEFELWIKDKNLCKNYRSISKFCLEFNLIEIAVTKGFVTYPTGKRGDRGFLLDKNAQQLLPGVLRTLLASKSQKSSTELVYVNGGIVGLPKEFFRILKSKG